MTLRPHLLDPFGDDPRLGPIATLSRLLYALHEAGADLAEPLGTLSRLLGRAVPAHEVAAGYGAMGHDAFARQLLAEGVAPPDDLTEDELLELVRRVVASEGTEFQLGWWLACLEHHTGDERIGDLLYWPGAYFGDGDDQRVLSPAEVLATARSSGGR